MEISKWSLLFLGFLIKYLIGLHSYSGAGKPPMYGDYEAQRHWMELTLHKPIKQWYFYDLQYWGLDYSPLTAYHSLLLGWFANWINPDWVALDISRGYETPDSKYFMRLTALVTDLVFLVPGILLYAQNRKSLVLVMILFPALQLIDHGHFQFNSAMLGLALLGFHFMLESRYVLGSILFVSSLLFKQMALFYSLPVFFYLLGQCAQLGWWKGLIRLVVLGMTVITTLVVSLLPFGIDRKVLYQIFYRVFPVARGLYEDKVANFWCAISIIIKLRSILTLDQLIKLSITCTLVAVLPACLFVFRYPIGLYFIRALAISSLGFFLFSFQVHEKSILLPLLPITMLYTQEKTFVVWFHNVALYSLWPLLKKDGLQLPYIAMLLLWNSVFIHQFYTTGWIQFGILGSYTLMLISHIAEMVIQPPSRLPDIHIMVNVLLSTTFFGLSFLYLYWRLFSTPKKK